jgi:hypothetical protein
MRALIKYISFAFAVIMFFSCDNKFIEETINISGVALSAVIISPEWEMDDYQFQCTNAGNANFIIESKPKWLRVGDNSGKFSDGIATITCKADIDEKFAKTGIYIDQMIVVAGGKKYAVPLYYVTEGNPNVSAPENFEISFDGFTTPLTLDNKGDGILFWEIISMPEWLQLDTAQLNMDNLLIAPNASANIPLKFYSKVPITGNLSGVITIRTNDKNKPSVSINVAVNLGIPNLNIYLYDSRINFGNTSTGQDIYFSNQGYGVLLWRFEDLPEWLTVSKASGNLFSYHSESLTLTCIRSKLQAGQNSAVIRLVSNDPTTPSYPITVTARAPGNNANVCALEGNINDATFDKRTNTLYYVTNQPNKLIAYDAVNRKILHEIPLSKAPTCLTVSENFEKALVGHGGQISVVNLISKTVTNTFEVSGIIADIEFAADNWCAYTESGNYTIQWTNIYWVNLSDGSWKKGSQVYEDCMIKKVPNQDYIIGSETEISAGVYVYDIYSRTEKADIFQSFRSFWFVGNYLVDANGNVYRVSDITSKNGYYTDGISAIGKLAYPENINYYGGIPYVDYCASSHSVFGLVRTNWDYIASHIYQFEDNDYTLINSFVIDDLYQPDSQATAYEVQPHYVFANREGTELSVLRKGTSNNNWSIEFITVTK